MYTKIIPLTKLPRGMGEFDYEVSEKLKEKIKIGQLAEIPWRHEEKKGVVTAFSKEKPRIKTKGVLRILDKEPFFYKAQIDLLRWASFYYCSSPATFFKMVMPEMPKSRPGAVGTRQCLPAQAGLVPTEKLKILKSDLPNIQYVLKKFSEQNKILFHWQNQNNKNAIYIKLLEKISKTSQIILIFPQINEIENFLEFLPANLKASISILHSEMAKTAYWKEWDRIRKNENGIIIGTRQSVFAPVSNLGALIIDNEHNASHKQWDQNPRYHSRECAKKLCELTGAKLILSSHTPSAETYYKAKEGGYAIVAEGDGDAGCLMEKSPLPPLWKRGESLQIIQMQNERKQGNNSIFCEQALELLGKNIFEKKLSLIYLNRRGTNKFTMCQDCGYIPQCPNCNLPLTVHGDLEESRTPSHQSLLMGRSAGLRCHHCGYEKNQPVPCPKCGGANIRFVGTGTQKIENFIKKKFPEAKTAKLDLDKKQEEIKNILKNINETDILIGTMALLSYNLRRKSDLIIFLNIDTDLMVSSYKAAENTIQNIKSFLLLLDRKGEMIIQTYSNNNTILKFFQNRAFKLNCSVAETEHRVRPLAECSVSTTRISKSLCNKSYYEEILDSREKFGYPPFLQLVKLTYKNKDSKIVKLKTEKLLELLNKRFHQDNTGSILGPVSLPVRFKKYSEEIIIKNRGGNENLQEWLAKNIPPDWIIDVDPVEI
ncbi:primosomal protein N' [Candidatus Falkowbacteria bacterium RBG_13_39_14]|uniref:Replication restart protein PriA n=1 Tax=Candidatus Falkowbacteria bacterium RBG_13_39_14 TaxID=1797985 RepID=A0A1F5S396_9BACT|nr:MAG: primosomal protein N' [Candidatus Falkowbacteria bacterium RBG_13_39_14]